MILLTLSHTAAYVLLGVAALVVGGVVGVLLSSTVMRNTLTKKSVQLLEEAKEKAEVIKKDKILQAKEKFLQMKADYEKETNERKREIQKLESRVQQQQQQANQREEEIRKKANEVKSQQQSVAALQENINKRQAELDKIQDEQKKMLESISGLTAGEAKEQLKEMMKDEAVAEAMVISRDIVEEAKMSANQEAKKIILETIQRTAAEHAIENTVSVFNIENDEIKGRIIGREGRNIRALESLTGVEIIIDDSPDAILLSGFDPIRREIARLSLQKLVTDGRIHPARIEEVVRKVEKQVEQEIIETGKRTVIDLGIHNLSPELIKMIGRMKYRSSYGL